MNIFGAASNTVAIINPPVPALLHASNGSVENADGSLTPAYVDVAISIRVQAMSSSDLQQVENITQQTDMRAVYIVGDIKGIDRSHQFGGDLLTFYGSDWLVTQQLEMWGEGRWSKLAVTRQLPST